MDIQNQLDFLCSDSTAEILFSYGDSWLNFTNPEPKTSTVQHNIISVKLLMEHNCTSKYKIINDRTVIFEVSPNFMTFKRNKYKSYEGTWITILSIHVDPQNLHADDIHSLETQKEGLTKEIAYLEKDGLKIGIEDKEDEKQLQALNNSFNILHQKMQPLIPTLYNLETLEPLLEIIPKS